MKAKTFENLIRKVVREEIDYSLRREIKSLKEDLRDELKPTITEHIEKQVEEQNTLITPTIKPIKTSLKEKIMGNSIPKKPIVRQNYTGNSSLNDLLNETAMGDTNTESGNLSANLATPFSSGDPLPIDTAGMPTDVAKAVTRDYSDLMGAILKKKK
tara:strand:+ start:795 stop:1265 length:471 start_codon:yes stop_codon:yes gene_type:complete